MKTLVIIPCSKTKVWAQNPLLGFIPARDAYNSDNFRTNREYAEATGHAWMVLSAKYGFLHPDRLISNYDVTFSVPESNPISMGDLKRQVRDLRLDAFDHVVTLGDRDYASKVREAFEETGTRVEWPVEGLRPGEMRSAVQRMTRQLGATDVGESPSEAAFHPVRDILQQSPRSAELSQSEPDGAADRHGFPQVWDLIRAHAGAEFRTKTGLEFTYRVAGRQVVTSRTNYGIGYADFERAYQLMPVDGPSVITRLVRGPAYVWAILTDSRVVRR